MALTDKLTAIADATRAKTGTTNQMTLDEIATAINGISISKGIIMMGYPISTKPLPIVRIKHSSYSQAVDTNFPFILVFGCYITGTSGMVGKIIKVDRNESTINEVDTLGQFGSSATLYYTMSDTEIEISTGSSNKTMTFSQTSTPGYITLIGARK